MSERRDIPAGTVEDIVDGVAIRRHPLIFIRPAPVVSKNCLEEIAVCTGRDPVQSIVGAHDGLNVGITGALLEWWEVVISEIIRLDNGVECITSCAIRV